jgi:hypothetical protein
MSYTIDGSSQADVYIDAYTYQRRKLCWSAANASASLLLNSTGRCASIKHRHSRSSARRAEGAVARGCDGVSVRERGRLEDWMPGRTDELDAPGPGTPSRSAESEPDTLLVLEEELSVGRERVETGRVRVVRVKVDPRAAAPAAGRGARRRRPSDQPAGLVRRILPRPPGRGRTSVSSRERKPPETDAAGTGLALRPRVRRKL